MQNNLKNVVLPTFFFGIFTKFFERKEKLGFIFPEFL